MQAATYEPGGLVSTNAPVAITAAYVAELSSAMRTNNPAVRAAVARKQSAEFNAASTRTWEDPMFKFGGVVGNTRSEKISLESMGASGGTHQSFFLDMGFDARSEGDLIYGIDQKLPLFGKAKRQAASALAEADALETRADALFQELRKKAAQLIFAIGLLDRLVVLGREEAGWLGQQLEWAQTRFRGGQGGVNEVTRLQNELDRLMERVRVEQQRGDQLRAELNRRSGVAVDRPFPLLVLPDLWPPLRDHGRLMALALKNDPRIRVSNAEKEAARVKVEATRRSRLPDVALGIEGRQFSGDGSFREGMFTASMSIPWFNGKRYHADIARERSSHEAADIEVTESELEVQAEVAALVRGIDAARREVLLQRDRIIPRSEQALEALRTGWISGNAMLADLLEARRLLLEARRSEARGISEQWTLLSELALCCGVGDLEALEMIEPPGTSTSEAIRKEKEVKP